MIRNQLKEKNHRKKQTHGGKQHVTKQLMGHWRNQRGNKKYLETNENENTMIQKLWNTANAVLRGKFIQYDPTAGNKKNLKSTT